MTIHVLIEKLHHAGISFTASPTGLKVVAAPGVVTPDILDEIRANKPALIAALSSARQHNPVDPVRPSTGPCLICGVPLDQDGGECWHRAFHMGVVKPQKQIESMEKIIL